MEERRHKYVMRRNNSTPIMFWVQLPTQIFSGHSTPSCHLLASWHTQVETMAYTQQIFVTSMVKGLSNKSISLKSCNDLVKQIVFNHYCAQGGTALSTTNAKYMYISMWYYIEADFGMKNRKTCICRSDTKGWTHYTVHSSPSQTLGYCVSTSGLK